MKRIIGSLLGFVVVFLFLFESIARADSPPAIERQVDSILSQMNLKDKLGQMSQRGFPRELNDEITQQIRNGRWGSFYGGAKPELRAQMQHIALTEGKLHIPLIFGADLIHGFRTTFPIPLAQSCSWNSDLVEQGARIAASEGATEGTHWTFSPMLDICRDPRWGRIAEGLGEDPQLAGDLAAALVHGLQGKSLADADSIAACGKHYVGYGAAEGGRDYNTTWIPEPLLRNVYLRPFAAAERAGCASFMSAFNDLNGIPASGNEFTLRKVLRDEWHFDGVVVSDYESIREMIPHGYAADQRDAAYKGLRAGVDMEMVSRCYFENGQSLVASGLVDQKWIDDSVRNILRLKLRLGLFGTKGEHPSAARATPTPHALEIARELAEQSIVLLKNDVHALPLARSVAKIAIIGPLADAPKDQLGTWTADREGPSVTPLAALRDMLGTDRIVYAPGLKDPRDESHEGFNAAQAAARNADVAILFLGESEDMSGEASARAYLDLPGAQDALAGEVLAAGKPTILVIMAGRPLTFHALAQKVPAILWAWHGGSEAGPAIARVLMGDVVPSGKLTVTFPRTIGQIPIYYDHFNTGRPAEETGPYADEHFVSKYIDERFTPEYPFGFGLSYTTYKYSKPRASVQEFPIGGEIRFSADVTNAGNVAGVEIVQFYTRQLVGSLTRPVRELRGYQRVNLQPGQTKTVEFRLKSDDLAYFGPAGTPIVEPGQFTAWIARDSASGAPIDFKLTAAPRN